MAEITEFNGENGEQVANERIKRCRGNKSKTLNLSSLFLTNIPIKLQECALDLNQHLLSLDLSDNQVTQIKNIEKINGLELLDLSHNKITKIENLKIFEVLYSLNLSDNNICEIENLESMKKLSHLYLSNNQISKIQNIEKLIGLTSLYLTNNGIAKIDNLEELTELMCLNLSNNQITKIENIEKLTQLDSLALSSNQINKIENLDTLTKLEYLFLQSNEITKIENIDTLTGLTHLNLSHNQITNIEEPTWFDSQQNLYLQINQNPFLKKRNIILDENKNHYHNLKLYFHKQSINEQVQVHLPQKVIFLGNHASGKSSSLNYLKSKRLKKSKKSTHVLDIEYILESKETNDIKPMFQASCYDFGGQDFYHGIYRIFLHDASMAVLLINPDNNHNYLGNQNVDSRYKTIEIHKTQYFDVRYWRGLLNYIQSGKQSTHDNLTLFTIQSHASKGVPKSWAIPALLEKPFLVNNVNNKHHQHRIELAGFYHLNLKDKVGENTTPIDLKSFHNKFTSHLKNTQNSFSLPQQEIDYLYDLMKKANDTKNPETSKEKKNKKDNYQPTTFNELKDTLSYLFKNYNYSLLQAQIRQYHRSGIVLYDESLQINKSDDIAKHIFWENPQGLVSFIHSELLSSEQINNGGIVTKDNFEKIIATNMADKSLNINQDSIIELLKLHQVIFEHKFRNNIEYIIPNYLPLSAEDNDYKLVNYSLGEPTFCLAFTDFIPVGMINQFINMFGGQADDKLFWRDAMMFTLSNGLNDKEKLFRVHLHIDMKKLMITVYVVDLAKQGTKQIISYLYYCLMNAYWNYLTNLRSLNYKLFNQVTTFPKQETQDDSDKEPQEYDFIYQLFDADNCYIPEDMYLSRDGDKFVKYSDIINTDSPMIPYHKVNKNDPLDSSQNTSHSIDMERMTDCKKTISVENFQYFTSKPLKRTARIFISYSHLDRTYKEDLFTHLVMLRRQGHHIFDDTQIGVGEFDEEIQKELREADIVMFLLSANFFNSEYIFHKEMTKVIETNLQNNRKQIVMPILIKYFDYHSLAEIINNGFTDDDLKNLLDGNKNNFESMEKNISAMNEFGKNLFLPYYKGADGAGKLFPIQGWEKDERDNAYAQIAQVVRKQIDNLPIQNFQPVRDAINDEKVVRINKRVRIFISYSHLDREYMDALMVHLAILERQGHHIFNDNNIVVTGKFDPRIQQELEKADIVVFMMSANFFNSEYIKKELTNVLRNNQSGNGKKQVIIPVLAKAFNVKSLSMLITDDFTQEHFDTLIKTDEKLRNEDTLKELGEYLFLPYYKDNKNGKGMLKPIQLWNKDERDSAYAQISEVIEKVIAEL